MKRALAFAAALAAAAFSAGSAGSQAARDQVWAVGSSTVYPFTTRVAESYARKSGAKAPRVESLGTGGGIKLFCSGVGLGTPDIANASRPMKRSEFDECRRNGVRDIVEIKIGYDGIVVAAPKDAPAFDLRLDHLYFALAKEPLRFRQFGPNPYTTWRQVGRTLPNQRITVYGPPPTSGTRDAFVELGLEAAAKRYPTMTALREADEDRFKRLAGTIREDGAWIDAGENDNAIVGTLTRTPGALGVFGFAFLEQNGDKVRGLTIDGVEPTVENVTSGRYPLSRSLYIYVKKAHVGVVPGLREFIAEYASDAATGRGGYLRQRGLIPLPADQHEANKVKARDLPAMARPAA